MFQTTDALWAGALPASVAAAAADTKSLRFMPVSWVVVSDAFFFQVSNRSVGKVKKRRLSLRTPGSFGLGTTDGHYSPPVL
ncbi:MAG: hypothetical protein NTV19_01790 [Burkholderiales bacterium]|nr:hypothetical protein [Burkholderiales bacterium]